MAASVFCISGLLVTVLILSTVNFAVMNQRHYLFPTSVVLYNIEPVRENFVLGSVAPTVDVNGYSKWNMLKTGLGCYNTSILEKEVISEDTIERLGLSQNPHKLSVCTCVDELSEIYYLTNGTKRAAKTVPDRFEMHVMEFCSINALPQYSKKFEGVVNVGAMQWVGQIFLVGAILYELMASKREKNTSMIINFANRVSMEQLNLWDRAIWVGSSFSVLLGTIIYFVYSMHWTSQSKPEEVGYRHSADMTKFDQGGPLSVFVFTLFAVLLITQSLSLLVRFMHTQNPIVTLMVQFFEADVLMNIGWLLLILALAIQAKMQSLLVLSSISFLVVCVGVVMYVSQMLRIVYNTTCDQLNSSAIHQLQTKQSQTELPIMKMRRFLRMIGYVRLSAFFVTAWLCILLLVMTDVTKEDSYLQNTAEGRYFYVVIAFLVSSVALDVVRECIPLEFENENSMNNISHFKTYFIIFYLLWLNISVCLWWRHVLVHIYNDSALHSS